MKKINITIIIIILIVIILCGITSLYKKRSSIDYGSVKVTTDTRFKTMRNDGGSHTNIYYQIDLKNKKVSKLEDNYRGFEGYIYRGKELYTKGLTGMEVRKLNELFNKLISYTASDEEKKNANYSYYTFTGITGEEIEVYNEEIIKEFSNLVKD